MMKTILNKLQMIVLGCYDLIRSVIKTEGRVGLISVVVYSEETVRELEERLNKLLLESDLDEFNAN